MRQLRLISAIICLLSACANYQKEKNIIVLTDDNFEEVLNEFSAILVHFYTPWCGVCKKLAPEYSKAASILEKENIVSGQIDSSINKNITKVYEVQKYPTLKLFIKGKVVDYTGENSEKAIIKFMRKKAGPLIKPMTSIEQIEEFKADYSVVMIYFGTNKEDLDIIEEIAKEHDFYTFGQCSIPYIYNHYNLTKETNFLMFKQFDEKRHDYTNTNKTFTKEHLLEFINFFYFPKTVYFNQYSAQLIFGYKKPGLFLYRTKHFDKRELYEDIVQEVADKLNRELQVVVTGLSDDYESRLAFLFGITAEDLPSIYIHDTRKRIITYKMKGEINEENIFDFVEQWKKDQLVPIWKSEEVPSEQGYIYKIVGKTYESAVLKSKRDVLILFLSPYEESVKQFWYSYGDIAIKNKANKELLIAFIYSTHNDIESLEVDKIPSLYLWKADKKELLLYEGDLSMSSVEMFLKEKSIYPFEIKEGENKGEEIKREKHEEEQIKDEQKTEEEKHEIIKEDL